MFWAGQLRRHSKSWKNSWKFSLSNQVEPKYSVCIRLVQRQIKTARGITSGTNIVTFQLVTTPKCQSMDITEEAQRVDGKLLAYTSDNSSMSLSFNYVDIPGKETELLGSWSIDKCYDTRSLAEYARCPSIEIPISKLKQQLSTRPTDDVDRRINEILKMIIKRAYGRNESNVIVCCDRYFGELQKKEEQGRLSTAVAFT